MIHGEGVVLRPAEEADAHPVYEWLAESDVTAAMLGGPTFPETPAPTWDEFRADYDAHFWGEGRPTEGSYIIEVAGRPVGHVEYAVIREGTAELDIWLRSEAACGHGYGPAALRALTAALHDELGVREFIMRPSARNPRAIAAYRKAGFELVGASPKEQTERYGPGDYPDAVLLRRRLG